MSSASDMFEFNSTSRRIIKCLGCKREFGDFRDYNSHECPEPRSGEMYK